MGTLPRFEPVEEIEADEVLPCWASISSWELTVSIFGVNREWGGCHNIGCTIGGSCKSRSKRGRGTAWHIENSGRFFTGCKSLCMTKLSSRHDYLCMLSYGALHNSTWSASFVGRLILESHEARRNFKLYLSFFCLQLRDEAGEHSEEYESFSKGFCCGYGRSVFLMVLPQEASSAAAL